MKCSDISNQSVIDAVNRSIDLQSVRFGFPAIWASFDDVSTFFQGVPDKLLRAKLRNMIRSNMLKGCTCGCRGDFEVVGQERW